MTRTIAKVVHDLKPSIEAINDVIQVLEEMTVHLTDKKFAQEFQEGLHTVSSLAHTISKYIKELDAEAIREGIKK